MIKEMEGEGPFPPFLPLLFLPGVRAEVGDPTLLGKLLYHLYPSAAAQLLFPAWNVPPPLGECFKSVLCGFDIPLIKPPTIHRLLQKRGEAF